MIEKSENKKRKKIHAINENIKYIFILQQHKYQSSTNNPEKNWYKLNI